MIELDLAEAARERFDLPAAEGRYRRALDLLSKSDAAKRMVALRGLGLVRMSTGRGAEALGDLTEAASLARQLGDGEAELELLLAQATAHDWTNDAPAAALLVAKAEELARTVPTPGWLRASLLTGRGRSQFRAGEWTEAWSTLQAAVQVAERLGAAGFEPLMAALILLEVLLPYLGRIPEAESAATRAIGLARSRGDKLHLASALNNRRNLMVANKDLAGAIADQRAFRDLGRELGLSLPEYYAEFNLAELHYQSGDLTLAFPFAARAVRFEEWMPSIAPRPVARLLEARLAAWQGLDKEANAKLVLVRASTEKARAAGQPSGLLLPSEEVLASMVELSSRPAADDEWDALLARSTRDSREQEPIEVLELRALAARRQGRNDVARRSFTEALALAAKIPNLLEARLRGGLALAS